MNPWAGPLKGILSEHPEQALMFIENSFQTTALTWILSLGKKLSLQLRKNRFAMEKASGHLKEHRAARWMERMKRIICHLDGWRLADGGGCNGIDAYRTALGAWASLDISTYRNSETPIYR